MKIRFQESGVFPQGMAPSDEVRLLQLIEICGRTAYKSEDKITPDSAKAFVLMLKNHGHLSVLEHSNIVLKIEAAPDKRQPGSSTTLVGEFSERLIGSLKERNAYHRVSTLPPPFPAAAVIAGNLRGWIETLAYLKNSSEGLYAPFGTALNRSYPVLFQAVDLPVQDADYQVTVMDEKEQLAVLKNEPASDLPVFVFKFVCDRGITHEVVRHRVLSFTQESTRYVNYQNKGMVLILPEELQEYYDSNTEQLVADHPLAQAWTQRAETIFAWYQEDLARGLKPQIARDILPNLLKSDIFVSGRWSGWKHFIGLRDSQAAHPRIRTIAREVRSYFDSLGLVGS
jgi:thymidylate synthase (FAD)